MPSAGFYAIANAKLRFASDGRWYADGDPVLHRRLASLFSRYLRRKPGGGYEIWIDERYHADVEVDDTPYVVIGVNRAGPGFTVELNDGSTESLDADGLHIGRGNVLYCRVKQGAERARFLRPAYYQLAEFIEDVGGGQYRLRCGDATHTITHD